MVYYNRTITHNMREREVNREKESKKNQQKTNSEGNGGRSFHPRTRNADGDDSSSKWSDEGGGIDRCDVQIKPWFRCVVRYGMAKGRGVIIK